jgi:hypothetical protein
MTDADSSLAKLQGFFGNKNTTLTPDQYRQMLEQALSDSTTGHALLRYAAQQRLAIHVVPGKGTSGYIPENRAVYIALPPGLSTLQPMDVLELGAYLRQAELQFLGAKNPDNSMSSDDFLIAFDSKIIDSIAVMCKIASELEQKGKPEFLDALRATGHSELYEVYSQYGQGKELVDTYYKIIDKTA